MRTKIFLLPCLLVIFAGCKKQLEDKTYDKLVPSLYFNNDAEAVSASNSIYGAMNGTGWDYYGAGNERIQMLNDGTTDIFATTSGSGYYADLINLNWKAPDYSFQVNWKDAYQGISYCNYILQYLPSAKGVSDAKKKQVLAEARVGLGLFYKDLVALFGDVPLITSFDEGIKSSPAKSSTSDVFNFVKGQLNLAIPDLPTVYGDADRGRFTQGAAYGLLCKIYMYQKNWDSVVYCANKIISSGQYELDKSGYGNLFTPTNQKNKEFILMKECYPDFNTGNTMPTYCLPPDYALPSGVSIQIWNVYRVRRAFYDSFDSQDSRKSLIVDRYPNTNGSTTVLPTAADVICMKYAFDSKAYIVFGTNAMPIIRLADIILAKAEALNQLNGPTQEAVDLVNQIRDRAFNGDISKYKKLSDFPDKTSLNNWILSERGWEFYFEGERREDLIRNGKFLEKATERGAVDPSSKRLVFPIPQSEIDINPNLKQNTGY